MKQLVYFSSGISFAFDDSLGTLIGKALVADVLSARIENAIKFHQMENQIMKLASERGCSIGYAACNPNIEDLSMLKSLDFGETLVHYLLLHPYECESYTDGNLVVICGAAIIIKLDGCFFRLIVLEKDFKEIAGI